MLQGKVALVTGASRGIGKAIAAAFAQEGAKVALVYVGNEQAAKEALAEITAKGAEARLYRCDVADFEQTKELCAKVLSDFGTVDILVNNAGIVRDSLVLNMKEEDFDRVLDTNLKGAFHMIRHLYSTFMKKRSGRIINITSVSGIAGNAGQANYSAAKAGMIGLTKSVARELAGRGVTCNAIAPGFIQTDMTGALPEKVLEVVNAQIPMKKFGVPEDIASAALFLACDRAGYITGEVLKVDGGLCM